MNKWEFDSGVCVCVCSYKFETNASHRNDVWVAQSSSFLMMWQLGGGLVYADVLYGHDCDILRKQKALAHYTCSRNNAHTTMHHIAFGHATINLCIEFMANCLAANKATTIARIVMGLFLFVLQWNWRPHVSVWVMNCAPQKQQQLSVSACKLNTWGVRWHWSYSIDCGCNIKWN